MLMSWGERGIIMTLQKMKDLRIRAINLKELGEISDEELENDYIQITASPHAEWHFIKKNQGISNEDIEWDNKKGEAYIEIYDEKTEKYINIALIDLL